jgi:putative glycosyltransferase
MKLSVVATLYRSAPYVAEFCRRAGAAARQLAGDDYEIVLVNDGSPDNSLDVAIDVSRADNHVLVVDLSRNFGHHRAMMAGLEHSRGELVFLIDSDLEEEPEWLASFASDMSASQADVIYGRQEARKGAWFERWSGEAYYSLLSWLCNIEHPRNIVTARLMSRRYVNALLQHRERELVISCLWVITGFTQQERMVKKHASAATTYNFSKKIELAVNTVTSFSEVPLKIIFYVGTAIFFCAIAYAGVLAFYRLFLSRTVDGWTSVMVSIWLLGGMVISFVGIVGIYLAKVFSETKQRPYFIVRNIYGQPRSED